MSSKQSAARLSFGYALPALIALAAVGGYTAHVVSRAQATIAVTPHAGPPAPPPDDGEVRWLKGQTHAHTAQSADCQEPVEGVLAAYADAGFDFVVLTDHNHVTVASGPAGLLVIPGVELTQNVQRCDPMPEDQPGCAVHVNALFVDPAKADDAFLESRSQRVADLYAVGLRAAHAMGGLAQLNHPNYRYTAADPRLLLELSRQGMALIEVGNQAKDVNSQGDDRHPDVETLWDQALTLGARMYAVATDDAHNYSDAEAWRAKGNQPAVPNQGFVYVRARKSPPSIRAALEAGDFYASTGVVLADLRVTAELMLVDVGPSQPDATIRFVGEGGRVLHEQRGPAALYSLQKAPGRYVRAVVQRGEQRAWVQPVFLEQAVAGPTSP